MPDRFAALRETRAAHPERIAAALRARPRRGLVEGDGRLFIIAADHPARNALAAGGRPAAMADRYDLLDRIITALDRPGVDGVLGTPDVLEDLALLGALDGRIAVGSMNRGGLRGAAFELDDRFTGYDVPGMVDHGLDMAKLLVRVGLDDPATARTLEATAHAITASARAGLPIMIEPFMSSRAGGAIVNDLSADAVIASVGIAAALGATSAWSWLKLPVVPDMPRVMAATTLPTLLLGGDPATDQAELFATWADALALPGVRGMVAGRTLLYPKDDDVAGAVDQVAGLVHPARHEGSDA